LNPARGFVATANHNIQPQTYSPPLMFKNADIRFERITRLSQMIAGGRKYGIDDHRRMQLDALSLRAVADIPLFKGWTSAAPAVERARTLVAEWDGVYRRDSAAAAVYDSWRTISASDGDGARTETASGRQDVEARLVKALARLTTQQGSDPSHWRWGRMHTRAFAHPFVSAFDLPTVERPGGAGTVAADGASYREILDTSNWDNSIATNTPGQSAQPGSPFYNNLLPLWTDDQYFPLAFSPRAVEKHTKYTLVLRKP
jgi:penicillin amidase